MPNSTAAPTTVPPGRRRSPWPHRGQAGFTLIELLVTATIVSVLAAMAVPKFMTTLEKAKSGRAIAEITIIRDAVENHRAMHGAVLPANMAELIPDSLGNPPLDPWGKPYIFNNFKYIPEATRRVDSFGELLNHEYDIFSLGSNGKTDPIIVKGTANDDIVMGRDGSYIGPSADY